MTNLIEGYIPFIMSEGFNTNKNIVVGGSANVDMSGSTGTFKFPTGAVTFGGGAVSGFAAPIIQSALVGATVVLTAAQSGVVCINRSTSGTPSWTLPAATTAGLEYTFICGNTTAGFTVTGAQVIHFKTSASGTVLTSTTTLTNTQGTAIVGDFISIVSDGAVWWMTGISGTFAAS
jgi:hypothetical protein